MNDDFFAPPAFDPAQALLGLKRQLRDLQLSERGSGFEHKGLPVAQLQHDGTAIHARTVKRMIRTPEWSEQALRSAADVRRFVEQVKRLLAGRSDEA